MCWFIIAAFALAAQWEFYQLQHKRRHFPLKWFGMIMGILLFAGSWICFIGRPQLASSWGDLELGIVVITALGGLVRLVIWPVAEYDLIASVGATVIGVLYVPLLFNFVCALAFDHGQIRDHPFWLFYLLVVTKFTDVGAYVIGSLIGRRKLAPTVSPGKTVEGLIGGLVTGLVFSITLVAAWGLSAPLSILQATFLGLIFPGVGTVGDLAESVIKRDAGVKDSGNMVPGIGGALDLLDSLLFSAPLLYVLQRLIDP